MPKAYQCYDESNRIVSWRSKGRAGLMVKEGFCVEMASVIRMPNGCKEISGKCVPSRWNTGVGHELGGLRRQRLTTEAWGSWLGSGRK